MLKPIAVGTFIALIVAYGLGVNKPQSVEQRVASVSVTGTKCNELTMPGAGNTPSSIVRFPEGCVPAAEYEAAFDAAYKKTAPPAITWESVTRPEALLAFAFLVAFCLFVVWYSLRARTRRHEAELLSGPPTFDLGSLSNPSDGSGDDRSRWDPNA
ncbi:MAG: hypothetical protein WBD02_09390 [Acidimicrobiia bacterium]